MKKIFSLVLVLIMLAALVLTACGEKPEDNKAGTGDNAGGNVSGGDNSNEQDDKNAAIDTKEALTSIMTKTRESTANDDSIFVPPTFEDPVTADNCENMLGLTPEQFNQYVTDAYSSSAAIITQAFQVALVKCKDSKAATEVKNLIAGGFNSQKWVCVIPEQCFVVEAGSFVLLGAVYDNVAGALQNSFNEQFEGRAGNVNKFYERGSDVPAEGGLGGGLILD